MKNIRIFLPENFHFLVVKFSIYLNRHVFVMDLPLMILVLYVYQISWLNGLDRTAIMTTRTCIYSRTSMARTPLGP